MRSKPHDLLQKTPTLEEYKIFLAKNKVLGLDEMKGLEAFINHVQKMTQKYLEQSNKNSKTISTNEALVNSLKEKRIPRRPKGTPLQRGIHSLSPRQLAQGDFVHTGTVMEWLTTEPDAR